MKYHINAKEHIFAFVAVSAAVAGLATVGSLRADIESNQSLHDAAQNACIQLEGQLKAMERETEGMRCKREGPQAVCFELWGKKEELMREEQECFRQFGAQDQSGNECEQMQGVFQEIEQQKAALHCFSGEAPAECDLLSQKFEEHSRAVEECYSGTQAQRDAEGTECDHLKEARMAAEAGVGAMGCDSAVLPQECEDLRWKEEALRKEVHECFGRIQSQFGNGGGSGFPVQEFVPPREEQGYPEVRRDCSDIEQQIKRMKKERYKLCAQGMYPEKCRSVEGELSRLAEKLSRCTSNAYPGSQGQPVPQMQWNGNQMKPMPQVQWNGNQMQPMPPVQWNGDQPVEVQIFGCGNYKQELFRGKMKAEEICTQNPNTAECAESMNMVEDSARKLEQCTQSPPAGGWNQPQPIKMPYEQMPPQPWQGVEVRPMPYGTDGNGGTMGQPHMEMMPGMQPVPMEGGQYMQQPFPGGGQGMAKEQFGDIIRQARARLEEALRFVDSDMAGAIEEAMGALDELENKFAGGDREPTREDIEKLILRLEEVKRSVQERTKQQMGPGGDNRMMMEGGPGMQRPQRNVDEIVEELSLVFEKLIPRVFEIFEEEGVSVPAEVRESFQEAHSAFESILPICQGGEMKRRVCAAAVQEVFLILDENMRSFVEGQMMGNERLRTRIEELSREIEGKE